MPKPLSPEQLTELQANGVVIPGYGSPETGADTPTMPAGLIERTLGSTGLPHTVSVERMGDDPDAPASIERIHSLSLRESYRANHATVSAIMSPVMAMAGETVPNEVDLDLLQQLEQLEPIFASFEARGLAPEVVLRPANRPLDFWVNLVEYVEGSPLNPDEPDPAKPGTTRKVLRNGGLFVASNVEDRWMLLTNPYSQDPRWKLEVISGLERPGITNVTSYGYEDTGNNTPSKELNELLDDLGLETVPNRAGSDQLTQPDIHPAADGYLMHQLTRLAQQKTPLDSQTYSWLEGVLADGYVPVGVWRPVGGQVSLRWSGAGVVSAGIGVRPSGRGEEL